MSVLKFFRRLLARGRVLPPRLKSKHLQLADQDLARKAFYLAASALDAAGGPYQSKVNLLPPPWRFVYVMLVIDGQVNNGGFHQFFTNAAGRLDEHLVDDIAWLEHDGYKDVLNQAFRIYKGMDYQDQWNNRGKSWEFFTAPYKEGRFEKEDSTFYTIKPALDEVVGRQIRAHCKKYGALPQ